MVLVLGPWCWRPRYFAAGDSNPRRGPYGAIVMAELAALREEFPAVRVDVTYRCASRPPPAIMARLIDTELDRNEIWD